MLKSKWSALKIVFNYCSVEKGAKIKLLVGLGNPGKEYQSTRHNLGFQVIDYLTEKLNLSWQKEKFKGLYTIGTYQQQKIMLLRPLTYMNNSGECVRNFINYFLIPLENILVVYDDLSLPLGSFRYRQQGSSGGHNGIKSIIECLGTQKFQRIKVGIDSKHEVLWKDWVLQKFTSEEMKEIEKILPGLAERMLKWIKTG